MRIVKALYKASVWLAVVLFIVSATAIDSDTWVPLIVCVGSILYIGIAAIGKGARNEIQ